MIYEMHGIVSTLNATKISHRRMLDQTLFERWASARDKFSSLSTALKMGVDAITIDDATNAGAVAAIRLRASGHAVTFFVNPYYVETQQDHFFCELNAIFDLTNKIRVEFQGNSFNLENKLDVTFLRLDIKNSLLLCKSENERKSLVRSVANLFGVTKIVVPEHLKTVSVATLRALLRLGISIENHGWTHGNFSILNDDEIKFEIEAGRNWLRHELGIDSKIFAVPFGKYLPLNPEVENLCSLWLLANSDIPPGAVTRKVYNRQSIDEIKDKQDY